LVINIYSIHDARSEKHEVFLDLCRRNAVFRIKI